MLQPRFNLVILAIALVLPVAALGDGIHASAASCTQKRKIGCFTNYMPAVTAFAFHKASETLALMEANESTEEQRRRQRSLSEDMASVPDLPQRSSEDVAARSLAAPESARSSKFFCPQSASQALSRKSGLPAAVERRLHGKRRHEPADHDEDEGGDDDEENSKLERYDVDPATHPLP